MRKSLHEVWDLVNPENTDQRKEVEIASRKWFDPTQVQKSDIHSELTRECSTSILELVREDQFQRDSDERKQSNSNSTRKLSSSSPELRNME